MVGNGSIVVVGVKVWVLATLGVVDGVSDDVGGGEEGALVGKVVLLGTGVMVDVFVFVGVDVRVGVIVFDGVNDCVNVGEEDGVVVAVNVSVTTIAGFPMLNVLSR